MMVYSLHHQRNMLQSAGDYINNMQKAKFCNPPQYFNYEPTAYNYSTIPLGANIKKVIWLSLKSVSEVRSKGHSFLKENNLHKDIDKKWLQFQSFIRQAENYWNVAEMTVPKSSPLLYYYSFLNLVKAYLLANNENVTSFNVYHGITSKDNTWKGDISNKQIRIIEEKNKISIFPLYYKKSYTTKHFKNISIKNALSYVDSIASEFYQTYKNHMSCIGFKSVAGVDEKKNKIWLILAIRKHFNIRNFYRATPNINKFFEPIKIEKWNYSMNQMFEFKKQEWANYVFYQQRENEKVEHNKGLGKLDLDTKMSSIFGNYISPSYPYSNHNAYFNKPVIRENDVYPFNEELAIYIVMFFLSELVRYHPEYIDGVFNSESYWLIESFMLNAPTTFLQAISNKILNTCTIYN